MTTTRHSPAAPQRHPGLEVLAAFVDGRLSDRERRRTVQHLSRCEACRDVVAETVHLVTELDGGEGSENDPSDGEEPSGQAGRVLRPGVNRFRRALPVLGGLVAAGLAALLLWTATGGSFLSHRLRPMRVADLTASLDDDALRDRSADVTWENGPLELPAQRGDGAQGTWSGPPVPQTPRQAFRIGLRISFLDAMLRAGDVETATSLTYRLQGGGDLSDPGLQGVLLLLAGPADIGIQGDLESGGTPARALETLGEIDERLAGTWDADASSPLEFPDFYELGKWTGAALVAAQVGDVSWFDDPTTKGQLHKLRQQEWGDRCDPALATVTGLSVSAPDPEDLPSLDAALRHLIEVAGNDEDRRLSTTGLPPLSADVTPPDSVTTPESSDDTPDSPTPDGDTP